MNDFMTNVQNLLQQVRQMHWSDYLDILLVAFLIYRALPILRSTGTIRVAKVVIIGVILAWLTGVWELYTLRYLLNQILAIGLIAIVVLFQPELRRMLDHLGGLRLQNILGVEQPAQPMDPVIDQAALHDGALIIRDGRVAAAGCVLPLSESDRLSADLGTRHRAGVGMSEVSDAVVIIVSEETGAISVAVGGMLKRHLAPQTLARLLRNELCPDQEEKAGLVVRLRQMMKKDKEGQKT